MRSFSKIHFNASHEQLESWIPSELDVELAASTTLAQKEQILAIFRAETGESANKKEAGSSPILHPVGTRQDFATWQPGEMLRQPAEIRKAEWAFIESAENSYKTSAEPQGFEFDLLEESAPQEPSSDPEKETSLILEQARLQAEELILAAQAEADSVLLQAQEEIDEQKKEAYQQGRDQACREIEETLKATHMMVEEVQTWKTDLFSQGEHILVGMLKEIAQKMFGEGVELDTNALQINLSRIMDSSRGLGDLNIFLNPRDAKILDPSWSEYQILISGNKVKIIPSGKITRGGCFVKGDMGIVDGRVETQLSAILKTFDEANELTE